MVNLADVLNAPETAEAPPRRVLHVGCGPHNAMKLHSTFIGWQEIRLDIDPTVQPDIVASITDMAPVATDSMDGVYSSHNLEHLYPHEVPLALGEMRRVLKPGGFLLITMPDLQTVAEMVAADKLEDAAYESPMGPIAPIDILYGFRPSLAVGNLFMAHRTGFTARSLGATLCRAGFSEVRVQRTDWNLWAFAQKGDVPAESFSLFPRSAET